MLSEMSESNILPHRPIVTNFLFDFESDALNGE